MANTTVRSLLGLFVQRQPFEDIVPIVDELPAHTAVDAGNNTVLHHAAVWDRLDVCAYVVHRLREEGYDAATRISQVNDEDMTALDCAATSGNLDVVNFLLAFQLDKETLSECLVRVAAARCEEIGEITVALIKHGADVNHAGFCGRGPVHIAVREGNTIVLEECIAHGANPSTADQYELTPLHHAGHTDQVETASILINAGVDVHETTTAGLGAAHIAARANGAEVLDLLLQHDPSLANVMDSEGQYPLHFAAANNSFASVFVLLSYGADPTVTDCNGMTPAELAAQVDGGQPLVEALHTAEERWCQHHASTTLPTALTVRSLPSSPVSIRVSRDVARHSYHPTRRTTSLISSALCCSVPSDISVFEKPKQPRPRPSLQQNTTVMTTMATV